MSSSPCQCKESIRARAIELGAAACGFAAATRVDGAAIGIYDRWIADGKHGTMHYCARYSEQRSDPRLLLDGAHTVIACAFSYYTGDCQLPMAGKVARYAWGADYHWIVKSRLNALGEYIKANFGGEYRACVDTAPIRERYWAVKSGIGTIGINNQLIVPGYGSYVFLGELLWTGIVEPDTPSTASCTGCGACAKACPSQALDGAGGCDASRCLSYLTIEHRGPLPTGIDLHGTWYGCDRCQAVCPHNRHPRETAIPEFEPDTALMSLTPDDISTMSASRFRRLTAHSAMSRINLAQLIRNIDNQHD